MLGGIIHGLKIPVSGLVVGSCAVICICLIAWYIPTKGAILKATLIVAIFKMMLSPQAPPPAYIAVFFQGLMGELLFLNRKGYKLSCFILAILALLESGLQRILVLTIVYGNGLWKVVNQSINKLTGQKVFTNYSWLIGAGYVSLHIIVGILVGWWASRLPGRIHNWNKDERNRIIHHDIAAAGVTVKTGRRSKARIMLLIVWLLFTALWIQSYFRIGTPLLPSHVSIRILIRSVVIVLGWYFVAGPLLTRWLHNWLEKRKTRSKEEVQQVLALLPTTQQLILQSWEQSAKENGWKRIMQTCRTVLVNALDPVYRTIGGNRQEKIVYILTAPIQTGKTSSLVNWSQNREDIYGILTPVVNGKRMFLDISSGSYFEMEAAIGEREVYEVGRFVFSKSSFQKAGRIIQDGINKKAWVVIDEVGPLELRGEGFFKILKEVLSSQRTDQCTLLVVREGLVPKVKEAFNLREAIVVRSVSELPRPII